MAEVSPISLVRVDSTIGDSAQEFGNSLSPTKKVARPRMQLMRSHSQMAPEDKVKHDARVYTDLTGLFPSQSSLQSGDIAAAVRHCQYLASQKELSEDKKVEIRDLIRRFAALPMTLFNPAMQLKKKVELQRVLSPELDKLRSELKKHPEKDQDESFNIDLAVARAKLAVSFNHGVRRASGGVNKAQILMSLEDDVLGVFKPARKIPWYDIITQIKGLLGQLRLLNRRWSFAQVYAEEAAWKMDRIFKFNLAPAAKMTEIKNDKGVFLLYLGGYKELAKVLNDIQGPRKFGDDETAQFQKAAIYDFLTGNLDCHNENFFIRKNRHSVVLETKIIDHGNAFITRNPGRFGSKGNQYVWGSLPVMGRPWLPTIVKFVEQMPLEDLERFVDECPKGFITKGMRQGLFERFLILKIGLASGSIKNPRKLSEIHTDADTLQAVKKAFEKKEQKPIKGEKYDLDQNESE